ncbi:hypothetical protein [Nocardia sp. NPDC049526]|uniref:hypothetical protein n=1 Tax=Nocardia sp. NPDC049526 TaxID=3364316 RepID=UPI0037B1C9D9
MELGARVTKALGIDLMSLQMGRSFSLEQAGPKVADLILAAEPGQPQPIPDPPTTDGAAHGSGAANESSTVATTAVPQH